ncbi:MAG: head GIN domain-containing protein [Chitinophagaceae bacterium]
MKRTLLLLVPVIAICSCDFVHNGIKGNGNIKTETRKAGDFSSVDVSGVFELHITQGPAADVRIEGDENLMQYIVVETNGGELNIHTSDHNNLDPTGRIKVFVSAPTVKKINGSGASRVFSENKLTSSNMIDIDLSGASTAKLELDAPEVKAHASGASSIFLKGQTKTLHVEGNGASSIKAYELPSETADINVSGASDAEVFASVSLKADASGASTAKYKGPATVLSQHESGAGSVKRED